MTRNINVRLLPDGRVLTHWFQHDPNGPVQNPSGEVKSNMGQVKIDGARGRVACRPEQNTVLPQERDGEILICMTSPELRVVTCPTCIATPAYQEAWKVLQENLLKQTGQSASDVAAAAKMG